MTHLRLTTLALGAALVAGHAARAQSATPSERPIRIGIGGGVSMPVGDFKNGDASALRRDFKQGAAGQGYIEFRAPGTPFGFRASVTYNRFGVGNLQLGGSGAQAAAASDGYSQVLGGLANVSLQLPTGPIRPYVLAGLGAFNVKNTASLAATPGGVVAAPDESSTNFGVNGGAGVLIRLGGIEGFAEARVANVYTKQEKFANLKNLQYIPITFGLSF
jgi:opacity protein-like surface antigen